METVLAAVLGRPAPSVVERNLVSSIRQLVTSFLNAWHSRRYSVAFTFRMGTVDLLQLLFWLVE